MSQEDNSGGGSILPPGQGVSGEAASGITPAYTPNANTAVVGSSIIKRLPDEELFGLNRIQFQVLLGGDMSGARAGRDLFLGFLISGVIGLIGLIATADWDEVFTKGKWGTAVWAALMFAIVAASAIGAAIYDHMLRKVSKESAYSGLIGSLKKHFGIESK